MENKEQKIKMLVTAIDNESKRAESIDEAISKASGKSSISKVDFEGDEWNDYISEVNKNVIALDNDHEARYQYIMKEFHKMSAERKWDKVLVVNWYKSQMHVIGKHEKADTFDSMAMCTQLFIGWDALTKLINGAYDYKEGEPTDGLECHINKRYTIEEICEMLKEADINVSDEMVHMMFDEIIKAQTEHVIDNDSSIE